MSIRNLWLAIFTACFSAAVAQQPEHGALLVVTKQSHALTIVDADTLKVVAQVPIGEDPHEVVVGPDGRTAYVSNYGEGTLHTLAVVDLIGRKPLPPVDITPLRGAHGLFVHDGKLWFTAEGSKSLATLDPVTGKVGTRSPAPGRIRHISSGCHGTVQELSLRMPAQGRSASSIGLCPWRR